MSHEITINSDGQAEMAYIGNAPWHRLGQQVTGAMTAAQALEMARLDWQVNKVQLQLPDGRPATNCYATVRQDNGLVLGAVGKDFTPLQNADAFKFLDGVVGESLAMYETAGSIRGGRRVWMLAKLPESVAILDRDPLETYLLLANGHDGSMALNVMYTPIRVVCQNTLSAALQGEGRKFATQHTIGIGTRMQDASQVLGLSHAYFAEFVREAEILAKKRYTKAQLNTFLGELLGIDESRVAEIVANGGSAKTAQEKVVDEMFGLALHGAGNEEWGKTMWGLYQGVTEYIDYHANTQTANPAERRLEVSWFRRGARQRQQAWNILSSMAGV